MITFRLLVEAECGVPQGSVLGSLLFLLLINDIVSCSDKLKLILFADERNLINQDNDMLNVENTVNAELVKI